MSTVVLTILIAAVLILLSLLGMAIGWLWKGKALKRGTCGYDPTQKKKDEECGDDPSCPVCGTDVDMKKLPPKNEDNGS